MKKRQLKKNYTKQMKEENLVWEYLEYLEKDAEKKETAYLSELLSYIDSTEKQLAKVQQELQEIKKQSQVIPDTKVKNFFQPLVKDIEDKLTIAKGQVLEAKKLIIGEIKGYLSSVKRKGNELAIKTIDALSIRKALSGLHNTLQGIERKINNGIKTLALISEEMNHAKYHMKKINSLLTGKEKEKICVDERKGAIKHLCSGMESVKKGIASLENNTIKGMQRIDAMNAKYGEGRSSVKEALDRIKAQQVSGNHAKKEKALIR